MAGQKKYLYILFVAVIGWALYCFNPWALYFQNDDFTHLLLSSKCVLFQRKSFRPVCDLSVILDFALWGRNAWGYHLTNLTLHIICSILVYVFSKRMFELYYPRDKQTLLAAVAALLFFAYPMHSESVFWVLGRSGTLGAIFSLLFLLFFVKQRYSKIDVLAYNAFYSIALLTYESCWAIPVAAIVLLAGTGVNIWAVIKSRAYHFIDIAVVFIIYLVARYMVSNEVVGEYEGQYFIHFNMAVLAKQFFQLLVRSFTAYRETPATITIAFGLLAMLMLYVFLGKQKDSRTKAACIFIAFVLCLLPCISVGIDTHGTEGERFLYLPSVFVCLFAAIILHNMPPKPATIIITLFCIVYSAQLYINAGNYRLAGKVVKQTIDELGKQPDGKIILIQGLPRAQHGALLMENGLPDAINFWGLNNADNIKILSERSELMPLTPPYKTVYGKATDTTTGIRFVYTDSALVIYK